MKITTCKLTFAAAMLTAVFGFGVQPGWAGTYGNDRWCAVTNDGGDALNWDCEYDTVDDCYPAVVQGSRGFCSVNPYWQPPPPTFAQSPQPGPQQLTPGIRGN